MPCSSLVFLSLYLVSAISSGKVPHFEVAKPHTDNEQGPTQHYFRSSPSLYLLSGDLPWLRNLARPSEDIWIFHGCFSVSVTWKPTLRNADDRSLNGIGAGPAETIQPAIIADIFFLHDRGKWNTLYWVVYMGSLMIAPIISGSMAVHVGWRNFWWLYTALVVLSIAMVVFMFPETKYHRAHPSEHAAIGGEKMTSNSSPKQSEAVLEQTATNNELGHVDTAARDPYLGRGKPSKAQWGLFTPSPNPLRAIFLDLWIPWKLFAFPIVELAAFVVSWSCSSFLTLNLTQTQAFAAPPYLFTTEQIGFTNFAILVGAMIGLFTAGPLSDWVSARKTLQNRGIREPEMRLLAMIPYVIVSQSIWESSTTNGIFWLQFT